MSMDQEDRESVVPGHETLTGQRQRTGNGGNNGSSNFDPYFLANSDNPGMSLVTNLFDGTNYQSWSRNVKRALASKMKLGFINGGLVKPERDSPDHHRWERCDNMVMSWLICSMTSEVSRNFVYATTARELWADLAEQYAESNAPLIFQLQREVANIKQENMVVGAYYGKLKRLWDELGAISEIPVCTCGAYELCSCTLLKRFVDRENITKLMQFLMGLSDTYEGVRNSILAMDPLPSVAKAFHMVFAVETQKQITGNAPQAHDALAVNRGGFNGQRNGSGNYKGGYNGGNADVGKGSNAGTGKEPAGNFSRDFKRAKFDRKCSYCQENGHVKETCFKLVGYPEWWKGPKVESSGKMMANIQETSNYNTPLDHDEKESNKGDPSLVNVVVQQVLKAIKGKGPMEEGSGSGYGYANAINFAGPYN